MKKYQQNIMMKSAKLDLNPLHAITIDLTPFVFFNAGNIVRETAIICGGKGGGKPDLAMAGGTEPKKLKEALNLVETIVKG